MNFPYIFNNFTSLNQYLTEYFEIINATYLHMEKNMLCSN
jgi:hypothetical protein